MNIERLKEVINEVMAPGDGHTDVWQTQEYKRELDVLKAALGEEE